MSCGASSSRLQHKAEVLMRAECGIPGKSAQVPGAAEAVIHRK
jgi:hypothetical protein